MKVLGILCLFALTMFMGCNDKKEAVKETTIEVKVEKEADTEIKIGPDGGSVKTKKVEVEVKNDNQ
ncbi:MULTISPECIES: hypothetical protein [Algoriphagus]|uniref:Uncharacterized protein n=1 Tax=Algoriphagus hitonicola TaxID=435880 RepID=A0A1I2Q2G1_9BACT|nr:MULTISPECIES: hypothetical protein [Algoriphagus]SFG22552.1 hypothetical protein SAMN04487988_10284 [Algoriphagus hitonicola]